MTPTQAPKFRNKAESPGNPEKLRLPPTVLRFGWIAFFTDVGTEMAYPLLPAFLIALGGGAKALGVMEGVAESIAAAVKWWSGRRSDQAGARKPFVVIGYAIASFIRPALALAQSPLHVILVRSIDRVGKGIRAAPRDALVAASVPPERRGAAFGFERMMDNLGAVFGPMIAFSLARYSIPIRTIFAATIIPGMIAMALVLGLREERPALAERSPVDDDAERKARALSLATPLPPDVKKYLMVVALFSLGASADSFLILRMLDLGLPLALAPIVWLTLNAAKSALNVPGGKIGDRFGRKKTLLVSWLIYAAAYALFPLTKSVMLTWALIVGYGAYYGLSEGVEKALIAELSDARTRGRAYGGLHAVTGFAVLPANALFGYLYSAHIGWAFGLSSACAFVAAILLAIV